MKLYSPYRNDYRIIALKILLYLIIQKTWKETCPHAIPPIN